MTPKVTRNTLPSLLAILLLAAASAAQTPPANWPAQWKELTAPDFVKAIEQARGVCLLPFGIIE